MGRTARAGRSGKSITLVTQYDVELVQRIEAVTGKRMEEWPTDKEEIALLRERVDEAKQELHRILADREMKECLLLVFANKQDLPGGKSCGW